MKRLLIYILLSAAALFAPAPDAAAQHTLGVNFGIGSGSGGRFYPKQEMRTTWGLCSGGVSWRYYGPQRVINGFGLDLEWLQQAYSYAPYASLAEEGEELEWYTRKINSMVLPVVWQPHVYMFRHRLRLYGEAAATFFYNMSSTYENEIAREQGVEPWKGTYEHKIARDNRFAYGLAFGGGLAFLFGQWELNFRVRYYFGFGDILRNRNKYADNADDGPENPFWNTPLRSPLDNLNISVGVAFRFNKEGFREWTAPRRKRDKQMKSFNYKLD